MSVHHHGPVAGEIPVPHGGQEYDTINGEIIEKDSNGDYPVQDKDEKAIFQYLLKPSDAYDENGVYWADMPFSKKLSFIASVDAAEVRKELGAIGSMMKADPLSPIGWYFKNCVLPGAGLGLEGYVLFSIGNNSSLFASIWPQCWSKYTACNKQWVFAITYLEVIGIIVGQIFVGLVGDGIGRRYGLIQDAVVMFVGLLMLTAAWGTTLNGWVICYAWSLFFYSVGVGGEYPMTATSGMENGTGSGKVSTREDRLHRGRKVGMAFLMQGWGQLFNQVFLIVFLIIFHHGDGEPPYSAVAVQWTYRVVFAIPAVGTLWLVYYRTYKMPAASKQLIANKQKNKVTGYDYQSLQLAFRYFGPRLFATCFAWFANDVFFYGNKLFQAQFIAVITGGKATVMTNWLWNLVNIGVSLVGYYMGALLIDNKIYGRNNMMQVGFLMDFILFVVPAFHYKFYSSAEGTHAFMAMYFLSSFFNQFGPNMVTFIVAAEVFPTSIRASAHGFGAACGKLGALLASILYNYITVQQRFYVVPWFGLAGMITTFLFLPDVTGLDLKEQDRRWQFIREGREHEYHGIAIHPQHLSFYERMRGVGKNYDAELDYKQKVEEMRADWLQKQQLKYESDDANSLEQLDDTVYNDEVHSYFQRTSPYIGAKQADEPTPVELPASAEKN